MGERFANLTEGGMVTWAARGNLQLIANTLADQGIESNGPRRTERRTDAGDLLVWELLFPHGTQWGARMPFFIDWLDCAHPSLTNPQAGTLEHLSLATPEASTLNALLSGLGMSLDVSEGTPEVSIRVQTKDGVIHLQSTEETSAIRMG